jgi:hypothetical protein
MPRLRDEPQPPQAPKIDRRLTIATLQAVGVPLLAIIPLLAVAGVFGVAVQRSSADSGDLSVNVEYPGRTRLHSSGSIKIEVANRGEQARSGVSVGIDRQYVEAFSEVSLTPSVVRVSEGMYVVDIGEVPAAASRAVLVELSPQRYWRHEGTVSVFVEGGESVSVDLSTFVFP